MRLKTIRVCLVFISLILFLGACQLPNHYLIHPKKPAPSIETWAEEIHRDKLLIRLIWAKPNGSGPFPTVIVHPEGGKTAKKMKGIIWALASRGYVAVAIDYKRLIDGSYRKNLLVWRQQSDVTAALLYIKTKAFVDQKRIATLGFSQGGIYSLMIAAHAPNDIRAVVSYYPVTDFEYWLHKPRPRLIERFIFKIMRNHFRRQSGTKTDKEFRAFLKRVSPLPNAEKIKAPVLLIHGDKDRAASAEESQRLATRLRSLGRTVKLVIIPDAVHIFNFRQQQPASLAWKLTLDWIDKHLLKNPKKTE